MLINYHREIIRKPTYSGRIKTPCGDHPNGSCPKIPHDNPDPKS